MRFIYTDEAGTSEREPVCVVATVIVHADNQWRNLQKEIARVVQERVPANIQENFVIHATEIFSGGKTVKRDEWEFEDRLDFLKEILCIPFIHNVPISVGVEFKDQPHLDDEKFRSIGLGPNKLAHLRAFNTAMERADLFLRKYLKGAEVGTVVAEDLPEMKQVLSNYGLIHREAKVTLESHHLRPDRWQERLGIAPEPVTYQIEHIVDVPHFVKKGKAPLLQLADVCAFAFRHYLSGKAHGADLVLAMLGPNAGSQVINDKVWLSGSSSGLFNTETYWDEKQRARAMAAGVAFATLPPAIDA